MHVTRVVTVRSTDMTEGERAAAKEGEVRTTHRMVIEIPGDQKIEVQEMPIISEGKCGIGKGKLSMMVFEGAGGEKRKMMICTDRIEKAAADGAAIAANSKDIERHAYASALEGLRSARAGIQTSTDMGADARQHALDGIDAAIKEMEGNLAKAR